MMVVKKSQFAIYWNYLLKLLKHKWWVFIAGKLTGVPLWRRITHDWSKFMPIEFINYAGWYFGNKNEKHWSMAWNHHGNHNPHHPEYWLLSWCGDPDFYSGIGEEVIQNIVLLPMPETYVREMIADMIGTSKGYSGSWDIAAWLNKHGPEMLLHDDTKGILDTVMCELGYFLADNCDWSWRYKGDKRENNAG